jgi:hypothetical protein
MTKDKQMAKTKTQITGDGLLAEIDNNGTDFVVYDRIEYAEATSEGKEPSEIFRGKLCGWVKDC